MEATERRRRLLRTLALGIAGLLLGASHCATWAWPLAWLGLALLGSVLAEAHLGCVFAVRFAETAIAEHWLYDTLRAYLGLSSSKAALAVIAIWVMSTAVRSAPVILLRWGWRGACARSPFAFAAGATLGEWAWHRLAVWSWSDHLYAHGADPVIWGALRYLGWPIASGVVFAAGTTIGRAIATRAPSRAAGALIMVGALAAAPQPRRDARALEGVYVAAMADLDAVVVPPRGTRLVVLPEVAIARRTELARPEQLEVPVASKEAVEVLGGALAWSPANRLANVAWAADHRGIVLGVHVKRVLVPGGERPVFGVVAGEPFEQGTRWDVLAVGGHRVLPLVCIEALDRGWFQAAREGGAEVVAVLASDRPLMGSRVAAVQSASIARLRSVETGLPVVRASLGGDAGVFWPDGGEE